MQGRFEEGSESEELTALGYIHGLELSRPLLNIPEGVPVNRLEMGEALVCPAGFVTRQESSVTRPRRFLMTFVPG